MSKYFNIIASMKCPWLVISAIVILTAASSRAAESRNFSVPEQPKLFSTPLAEIAANEPRIQPWRSITLDPQYRGMWLVTGDLDGDREAEIVSARIHDVNDVHHTVSVIAYKLDGTVLWKWGKPDEGVFELHSDVACQIYDWDGDGKNEVVVGADQAIIELDGATGAEKRRFAIPAEASDSLLFCNLLGSTRPTDLIAKTRYTHLWAYEKAGQLLWEADMPGGFRTAHQPRPIDINGDGREELVAGFALLAPDGQLRWALRESDPALAGGKPIHEGHLDCARLVRQGARPADSRIAITFCGAERIAMVDGEGHVEWSMYGKHFESIDVGPVCPGHGKRQMVVDIPYAPRGEQPLWVIGLDGDLLGEIICDYSRIHRLIDWQGSGVESIVVASPPALYSGETGERLAIFDMPGGHVSARSPLAVPYLCFTGDMSGDGVQDVVFLDCATATVHIYKNEQDQVPAKPTPVGFGPNWTLY